jgi:hypothetical protein
MRLLHDTAANFYFRLSFCEKSIEWKKKLFSASHIFGMQTMLPLFSLFYVAVYIFPESRKLRESNQFLGFWS